MKLMKTIHKMKSTYVALISIFIAILIIVLAFNYDITAWINNCKAFQINTFEKIVYSYEKPIAAILFGLLILLGALCKGSNIIEGKYIDFRYFIVFERIYLSFYCLKESFVLIFFAIFKVLFQVSWGNIYFFGIGIFVSCCLISIFLTILFEIPFRVVVKRNK